jgi:tartronate-semialdehyde synthase
MTRHGFAIPPPIVPWTQWRPDSRLVEKAADMLARATFPLIHAGTGIIHAQAHEELMELAELLGSPGQHQLGRQKRHG